MDEANPAAVRRFLEPLIQRLGVSVIVTDDLQSYRKVAEKLGLEQQVCQFHVRRWVGLALHELKQTLPAAWLWVLDESNNSSWNCLRRSRRLFELWKLIPEKRTGQAEIARRWRSCATC